MQATLIAVLLFAQAVALNAPRLTESIVETGAPLQRDYAFSVVVPVTGLYEFSVCAATERKAQVFTIQAGTQIRTDALPDTARFNHCSTFQPKIPKMQLSKGKHVIHVSSKYPFNCGGLAIQYAPKKTGVPLT